MEVEEPHELSSLVDVEDRRAVDADCSCEAAAGHGSDRPVTSPPGMIVDEAAVRQAEPSIGACSRQSRMRSLLIALGYTVLGFGPRRHRPEFQDVKVGDAFPLGRGGPPMHVQVLEPERSLAYRFDDGDWVWSFNLDPQNGSTRRCPWAA